MAAGPINFGGWDVASGDFNNDGLDDIMIGMPGVSSNPATDPANQYPPDYRRYHFSSPPARINNGGAYIWLGRNSLTTSSARTDDIRVCLPEFTIYGEATTNWLGTAVATGDVDGDGYDDFIVGGPGFNSNSGGVYVFYGTDLEYATCGPTYDNWEVRDLTNAASANITLTGLPGSRSAAGYDVNIGNLNNDAYDDIIIGAPFGDNGTNGQGRVFIVYGRSRAEFPATLSLASQADVRITGAANSWLGASLIAGDLNQDAIDDLLIGAPDVDPDHGDIPETENSPNPGKVHVLFGGNLSSNINLSSGSNSADLTLLGAAADDWLGRGLAVADLNQDGFNEIIAGAAAVDYQGRIDTGAVYVVNLVYPHLTLTPSLTQLYSSQSVSFTATANTWLHGLSHVTDQTAFAISPAAGGSWSGNSYHSANPGVWTVTATYNSHSITTSITVLSPPVAAFSCGSCTAAEGAVVSFNGSGSTGQAPLSYAWSFGDGTSASGVTVMHNYGDDGVYQVSLTVQDSHGLISTITKPVTITNLAPVIQPVTNSGPVSFGSPVTITVTATDMPSDTLAYAFDCDNNGSFEIGPQASPQAICQFDTDGTFTVAARVTDEDGSSDQESISASVSAPGNPSYHSFLPLIRK